MNTDDRRRLDDYPVLQACASDLRSCSKDDRAADDVTYMFDREDMFAIDFDDVMRVFCQDGKPFGIARSVDALYVGPDEANWNETLTLIEFKNGNLNERRRSTLSSKDRRVFAQTLKRAIDEAIDQQIPLEKLSWDLREGLRDVLHDIAESQVRENLSNRGYAGRMTDDGDSYRIETVKSKAAYSALLLALILDVPVSYVQNHVNFILVYNWDENPATVDVIEEIGDNDVPDSPAFQGLGRLVAKNARRPLRRFGLWKSLGAFFRDVITCTADELCAQLPTTS